MCVCETDRQRDREMVDDVTRKTLAAIPLMRTNAGPRSGDGWTVCVCVCVCV